MGKKKSMKESRSVETEKRKISWSFVVGFLIGAIFGELAADPFSDFIFFMRVSSGVPMTPEEQIFYWDYVPGLIYLAIFFIAVALMAWTKLPPIYFMLGLVFVTSLSTILAIAKFKWTASVFVLLAFPFVVLIYLIFFQTTIKVKGQKYRV